MIKLLFNLILIIGLIYLIRQMFSPDKPKAEEAKPKPKPGAEPDAELLVEDPQCGVFVPVSHSVKGPGETRFCSRECLEAYKRANG